MNRDYKIATPGIRASSAYEHGVLTVGAVGRLDADMTKAFDSLDALSATVADLQRRLAKLDKDASK